MKAIRPRLYKTFSFSATLADAEKISTDIRLLVVYIASYSDSSDLEKVLSHACKV